MAFPSNTFNGGISESQWISFFRHIENLELGDSNVIISGKITMYLPSGHNNYIMYIMIAPEGTLDDSYVLLFDRRREYPGLYRKQFEDNQNEHNQDKDHEYDYKSCAPFGYQPIRNFERTATSYCLSGKQFVLFIKTMPHMAFIDFPNVKTKK